MKTERLKSIYSFLKIPFIASQTNLKPEMQDYWLQEQKRHFDQAKLISDFVGILMRMGFIWLAMLFFLKSAAKSSFWLEEYSLRACIGLSFGLYFLLFVKTMRFVDAFWLADLSRTNLGRMRTPMWYVSMLLTFVICYGITKLAGAIGSASSLTQ